MLPPSLADLGSLGLCWDVQGKCQPRRLAGPSLPVLSADWLEVLVVPYPSALLLTDAWSQGHHQPRGPRCMAS